MATSFRRKNHQDERASEASDFLCTRFRMCTKHLETVSTIGNHFMFLQMVEKKGHQQPLRNRSKLDSKFYIFFEPISSSRDFQHFSHLIAFAWSSHYYESGKNVFCRGIPTAIKFETNFELWEICLDGRHLSSFKNLHHPFLIIYQSKSIYSLLYGVLRRYEARKITKIEEFWWNK